MEHIFDFGQRYSVRHPEILTYLLGRAIIRHSMLEVQVIGLVMMILGDTEEYQKRYWAAPGHTVDDGWKEVLNLYPQKARPVYEQFCSVRTARNHLAHSAPAGFQSDTGNMTLARPRRWEKRFHPSEPVIKYDVRHYGIGDLSALIQEMDDCGIGIERLQRQIKGLQNK